MEPNNPETHRIVPLRFDSKEQYQKHIGAAFAAAREDMDKHANHFPASFTVWYKITPDAK